MKLTKREREIVQLMADGMKTTEMAQKLNISPKTIEIHSYNIKRKNGLKTASQVVAIAIREKIID